MFIQRLREKEEGFTLIELLIVVAIIAILAAIAIPQFSAYRERGVRASMVSDARNGATQMEALFSDDQTYVPGTGAATAGAPFNVVTTRGATISFVASANNTVNLAGLANTWTITVVNTGAGTGKSPLTMTSAGSCTYADLTLC